MKRSMESNGAPSRSDSRSALDGVEEAIGFVPNLFATLAQQPGVVEAFIALDAAFSSTTLTPEERQAVQISASVENGGSYCVAGHTQFSRKLGVPEPTLAALRASEPVDDARLDALQGLRIDACPQRHACRARRTCTATATIINSSSRSCRRRRRAALTRRR